jgi:NAD(P)-dependent dehydrogenase (short-subunit alcohol dehydrogenase family)
MQVGGTMGRLSGRVAIVTGGAEGIGATYAKALAAEGAKVCVADIQPHEGVIGAIKSAGGDAIGCKCDVTDVGQVAAMVKATLEAFGGIHILVNNAAVFARLSAVKPFEQLTREEWDLALAVNVRGVFECTRAVLPAMRRQGSGKVINVASGTAFKGTAGMLHYVASKGAVVSMTRSLANELGKDNITCNCIAPGLVMTDAIKTQPGIDHIRAGAIESRFLKRTQSPDDLVGTLIYLASKDSDFVSGQIIVVDGGSALH